MPLRADNATGFHWLPATLLSLGLFRAIASGRGRESSGERPGPRRVKSAGKSSSPSQSIEQPPARSVKAEWLPPNKKQAQSTVAAKRPGATRRSRRQAKRQCTGVLTRGDITNYRSPAVAVKREYNGSSPPSGVDAVSSLWVIRPSSRNVNHFASVDGGHRSKSSGPTG